MRRTFFSEVEGFYERNERVFVLTADLGFKLFDRIREIAPERFCNTGIAEANMIGAAAGIALAGGKVFCYSIIPFLVMRAYEQIRVDVDYHDLDVKLVGMGSGFSYGLEGITHFGLEDIALMRALRNVYIVSPADMLEAACFARISCEHEGPMYIRMGRTNALPVHKRRPCITLGKALILKEGRDAALLATGDAVHSSLRAADILEKAGISMTVADFHTIKPLDTETIEGLARDHDLLFTVEEHNRDGGFGSAVAEILSEAGSAIVLKRIGIPAKLGKTIGGADHLRKVYGIDADGIAERVAAEING